MNKEDYIYNFVKETNKLTMERFYHGEDKRHGIKSGLVYGIIAAGLTATTYNNLEDIAQHASLGIAATAMIVASAASFVNSYIANKKHNQTNEELKVLYDEHEKKRKLLNRL